MTRRIESQREQFPTRTAAHCPHQDLAESHRAHGTVHTTGGRVMPGWKLAVADTATQQSRLTDTTGWTHHVAVPPSSLAIQGAQAYANLRGFSDPHDTDYSHIMQSPDRVARVGRHFDSLPVYSPQAVPHFAAMADEVNDQYDFMTNRLGVKVQPVDHDPYAHVGEMMADVNNNKTLKVLGSHITGGHPVFGNEGNDKFRAVHDFFGHAATGRDFDRHGEHATYLAHSRMFSPQAVPALTTETLGQNSSLILNGHFGPNKIGIIPRHLTAARTARSDFYKAHDDWDDEDDDPEEGWHFDNHPVHGESARFTGTDRPVFYDEGLRRDVQHFSPHEHNPASTSPSRPWTDWSFPDDEQDPLPGLGQRQRTTRLYRGIALPLHHPDLHHIRRMLHGDQREDLLDGKKVMPYGLPGASSNTPEQPYLPGMPTNNDMGKMQPLSHEEMTRRAPELRDHIIDHILKNKSAYASGTVHDQHGGLGSHWTTDPNKAQEFAQTGSSWGVGSLPLMLSADWEGRGEDPYRRNTDGEYPSEKEITMLPGASMNISDMHIRLPGDSAFQDPTWLSLMGDGQSQRHHAVKNGLSGVIALLGDL